MKRIPLRMLPDRHLSVEDPNYAAAVMRWDEVIRQVLRSPANRQQGADIEEIRRSIHVLDALDHASDGELQLEDADWELLKEKLLAMRWGIVDERLLQFHDDIVMASDQVALNDHLSIGDRSDDLVAAARSRGNSRQR